MKILIFINGLGAGGAERQVTELAKGLKKEGIECEIVTMKQDVHYNEINQFRIHQVTRKTKKDILPFYRLYKLCKKIKPDIIHCWDAISAFYAVPASKILGIKLLNNSIQRAPEKKAIMLKEKALIKLTSLFSDITAANTQAGLESYGIKNGVYIHNGFDFSRTNSLENKESVKKKYGIKTEESIGMIASFTDYKDYETYIKTAKTVIEKRNDASFIAIGDGPNLQKYKERYENERILFLGRQKKVEEIINALDIGVLLTNTAKHGEGIPNAIMEFMALGKPVIATDGGGIKELIINGKYGFLVKPASSEEVAEKIEFLLNNPKMAKEMGEKCRKIIKDEFSMEKMTSNFIKIYFGMLEKKQ